jgi:hypothetical protein
MFIVPVPFAIEGHKMLQHTKWLLEEREEDGSSLVAIHREKFHKLVCALRTTVANGYKLDKEQTSYNDILDAFRLSLQFYRGAKLDRFVCRKSAKKLGFCCDQYEGFFYVPSSKHL